MRQRVFTRHGDGPILDPGTLDLDVDAVFNPGVAEMEGQVVLLLRIEDRTGISQIRVARSANGVDNWRVAPLPLLEPDLPEWPFEEWGCEDARVTPLGGNRWLIAYTAYSRYGPAVALATTEDFETAERIGVVLAPANKNAALVPGKFDGLYILLHRVVAGGQEHIWHARSEDLVHWSQPAVLLPERGGPWWDGLRIGVGAPPMRTDEGFLLIYHGVKEMGARLVYRLGLALLDLDDPRKATHRAAQWVFAPEADFEQRGLLPNVVYTCGALLRGDEVWMYYGAADTCVGLATADMRDLLTFVREHDFLRLVGKDKGMSE